MGFDIIGKKLIKKNFETSVLIFLRQDKRVSNLLNALSKQKYKNFVVLIANDSKEPFIKLEEIPKNLNYVYYHSSEEKYSPYDKINFLADQVNTPFIALTESDCEPSVNWLEDLIPLAKKENTVIKGCETRPLGCCTANLVFKSEILKKVKFDINIPLIADYEWGMDLERAGYKLKVYNNKGYVFHNTLVGKPRFNRIIPSARDEVYIAFKYKNPRFIIRKIIRNLYGVFLGLCLTGLYLFFIPYLFIRSLFSRKK